MRSISGGGGVRDAPEAEVRRVVGTTKRDQTCSCCSMGGTMRNWWKSASRMLEVVSLVGAAGCDDGAPLPPDKNTPVMKNNGALVRSRDEVAAIIANELSVGASSTQIEEFFRRHGLERSFDSSGGKGEYHSLSWVTQDHAISILIRVDTQKRMMLADVHDSYTGL